MSRPLRFLAKPCRRVMWTIALLICVPTTDAQSATHDVRVAIPDVIGIRILGAGTGPRSVIFDYAAAPDTYLAAVASDGQLPPTRIDRFDGIEVRTTRNGRWYVEVVATPLAYVGPDTLTGLALGDIRVDRGAVFGLVPDLIDHPGAADWNLPSWQLSTTARQIVSNRGATGGWRSLGFGGRDYVLTIDGDEAPGTYTTTVTYFLTAP
jgi:hypothetical protein